MRTLGSNRRHAALIIPLLALALPAGSTVAAAEMEDGEIAAAITTEMLSDEGVQGYRIDVEVDEGIATLTGSVNNALAEERAARIARAVKGVRSVVERIEVSAPERSDAKLKQDVKSALLFDPSTDSWEIDVEAKDQMVTLRGSVDSWHEKELAACVAKGVRGVEAVDNRIDISYEDERSDREIASEIRQLLHWDALVDDALIQVEVNDGEVSLSGVVGSASERRLAGGTAWVAGVQDVNTSGLDVEYWARDDRLRKDKYVAKSDSEIEAAVKDAFLYDPRVLSFEIDVDSKAGIVTLSGTVDNLKAKRSAEATAENTVGVWRVKNRIKVRPATPDDETIERRIEKRLLQNPHADRYEITTVVIDGEAHLYGTVDSYFEKAEADDVAASVYGVVEVSNHLIVDDADDAFTYDPYVDDDWVIHDYDWYTIAENGTNKSDWEILDDVRDELFWSPFVDANQVNVAVDDGIVTLTGTVDTMDERSAATENALEGGAAVVDNDLSVRYGPDLSS